MGPRFFFGATTIQWPDFVLRPVKAGRSRPLALPLHGGLTPSVQFEQLGCVLIRLRSRPRALKAHAGGSGTAIPCGHGNKFHEIKRDIFITTCARVQSWTFFHESFS